MRRYSFRLERLLEIKAFAERKAEIDLALAQRMRIEIEAEIDRLAKERARSQLARKGAPVAELAAIERYCVRLGRDAEKAARDLAVAEAEVARRQDAYLAASRERKVLDKLKERKAADYYFRQEKAEYDRLDDIANGMAVRRIEAADAAAGNVALEAAGRVS